MKFIKNQKVRNITTGKLLTVVSPNGFINKGEKYIPCADPNNVIDDLQDFNKEKSVYSSFSVFFEGVCSEGDLNYIEPEIPISTFSMGITKLRYIEKDNVLNVHLRRPGLLIGKGGKTFNELEKYLECKVNIIEVKNL